MSESHPSSSQAMLSTLSTSPHAFLQPTPALHAESIVAAKRYLDPLASAIRDVHELRRQESRRKRKRSREETRAAEKVLQIREVYSEGFTVAQVWEQAKRVLDAATDEVEGDLSEAINSTEAHVPSDNIENGPTKQGGDVHLMQFDEDGFEIGQPDDGSNDGLENYEGLDIEAEEEEELNKDLMNNTTSDWNANDMDSEEDIEMDVDEHESDNNVPKTYVQDPNRLNDGFFSIDDFNRQSQFLERQDARGDPNDGAASDEEDVDWNADPLLMPTSSAINGVNGVRAKNDEENEEEGSEDGGPTFGNAALDDGSDEGEDDMAEMDDMSGLGNTNDIKYADFFEPPAQTVSKSKRPRPLPKTQPAEERDDSNLENNIQRAMQDVRRDIFEDGTSSEEDSDADIDGNNPQSHRSTHENQKAKLAEEIRRLEAANVAKRDWTLSGEARAGDRPVNSLIEEDFEFERVGKPVPVITNEVTEEIEELIQRRILAREFDEVIRRRPEAVGQNHVRRGPFELDDNKPQQSLAEMYEADHLRATDPAYVDKRDEKLKKEHAEIDRLWKDISSKLDSLSNWHYKPKVPEASVNIVADAPTIMMEDARPAAGGEVGENTALAPQEVYAPGEGKMRGEVVPKSGAPVAKDEMTRDEKLRRRRREKERIKKKGLAPMAGKGGKAAEKQGILSDLRKGGVQVIGKKGDIKDIDGRKVKGSRAVKGADYLKL